MQQVLHVVDCTCGLDTLDIVSLITKNVPGRHHILVLGHRSWLDAALSAGIPKSALIWNRGLSAWDPALRRGVRKIVALTEPTHLQAWGLWGLRTLSGEIGFDGPHITFLQTPPPQNQIGLILDAFRRRRWLLVSPWQTTLDAFIANGIAPQRVVKVNPAARSASNDTSLAKNFRRNLGLEPKNGPVVLLGGWPEKNLRHDHGIWALGIVAKIQPQIWGIIRIGRTQRSQRANSLTGYGYFRSTLEDPGLIAMAPPEFSWRQLLMISDLFVFMPDRAVGMNSLLEAMAMGKPIVSTATSQVQEVLQDDRNALLAPAGNPKEIAGRINTLLINSQLIERLGHEAKNAFGILYKPEILIEQMQSIYAQTSQDPYLREPVVLSEELNNYIGNAD